MQTWNIVTCTVPVPQYVGDGFFGSSLLWLARVAVTMPTLTTL